MATPLFFPRSRIVVDLRLLNARPLKQLIEEAGAVCRASGAWVNRRVELVPGADIIERQPGDCGDVRIGVPKGLSELRRARYAVAALAYELMDGVARQSICGQPWAKPAFPAGRPATGVAQTTAERQRAFRARRSV